MARPNLYDSTSNTVVIAFSTSKQHVEALEFVARSAGVTRSRAVNLIIEHFLKSACVDDVDLLTGFGINEKVPLQQLIKEKSEKLPLVGNKIEFN